MAISDIKKSFGVRRPERTPAPPPKEEKKDTSAFRGRSEFSTKEYNRWLESDEAYRATQLPKEIRLKLGPQLSDQKLVGSLFEKAKREPEKIKKELELGKYGAFSKLKPVERKILMKLYKGFWEQKK